MIFFSKKNKHKTLGKYSQLNWDNCDSQANGEMHVVNTYSRDWEVCFDIGSNRGEYAANIMKSNSSCNIYCFEPNESLIEDIKKKGIKKIYNYAVSNKSGYENIHLNLQNDRQSSKYRQNMDTVCKKIKSISIDDFVVEHNISFIDFVKIDTEGNEKLVIEGMKRVIKNHQVGMIQFEYGGTYQDAKASLKDIYQLLQYKYIICMIMPEGLIPLKYSKTLETYRYSNWLAISRKWSV